MTSLVDMEPAASADDAFNSPSWPNNSTSGSTHYTPSGGASNNIDTGYRYELDTDIPDGATFEDGCFMELYYGDWTSTPAADIYGEEASTPAIFSGSRYPEDVGNLTTATVQWDITSHTGTGSYEVLPEIKTILQEIMDDKSGSSDLTHIMLVLFEADTANTDYASVSSQDAGSNPPLLTIEYTAGSTTYDETGLAVTVTVSTGGTDEYVEDETGLAVDVDVTVGLTDSQDYSDTLAVPVVVATGVSDSLSVGELDRPTDVVVAVGVTDQQTYDETGLAVSVVVSTGGTDTLGQEEPDLAVAVVVTTGLTEEYIQAETVAVSVVVSTGVTDSLTQVETGLAVNVQVTTGGTDSLDVPGSYDELNLATNVVVSTSIADVQTYVETGLAVAVLVGIGKAASQVYSDTLGVGVVVSTGVSDSLSGTTEAYIDLTAKYDPYTDLSAINDPYTDLTAQN